MTINDAKADFACAKWPHMSVSYELLTLFYNNNKIFHVTGPAVFQGFCLSISMLLHLVSVSQSHPHILIIMTTALVSLIALIQYLIFLEKSSRNFTFRALFSFTIASEVVISTSENKSSKISREVIT